MENASKALIMAGSILISIMIISLLIFGFNQISHLEQTKEDAELVDIMAEYTRRFEQFNRTVYGSELLSLGNLAEDYDHSYKRVEAGFAPVDITVKITKGITDSNNYNFFTAGNYPIDKIIEQQRNIEDEIEPFEQSNPDYNNRSVKFYSQKSNREIAKDFGFEIPSYVPEYEIFMAGGYLEQHRNEGKYNSLMKCMDDIQEYTNLKSIYNEFKTGMQFSCAITHNTVNGSVESMIFTQI